MEKEELLYLYQQIYQTIQYKLPVHDEHDTLFILNKLVDSLLQKTDQRPIPSFSLFSQNPAISNNFHLLLEDKLIKAFQEKNRHTIYAQQLKKIVVSVENIAKGQDSIFEDQEHIREQLKLIPPGAVRIRLRKLTDLDLTETTITKEESDFLIHDILKIEELNEDKIGAFNETELTEIQRISLLLYSERFNQEISRSEGPVHIIHFYEHGYAEEDYHGKPRHSESLLGYNSDDESDETDISFNHTSHGLGSGVYGRGSLNVDEIQEQIERRSHFEIIEIANPLRLHDTPSVNRSEEYTELSKGLQRMADKIKALQFHNARTTSKMTRNEAIEKQLLIEKEAFDELTIKLLNILSINITQEHFDFMSNLLKNAITQFFEAAKKSDNLGLVNMPINYVLKQLGYSGVISSNNDSFNRGLLAMEYTSPKKIIISPVKMGVHRKASTEHPRTPLTKHVLNETSNTGKWKSARILTEKENDSELSNDFLGETHRKRPR